MSSWEYKDYDKGVIEVELPSWESFMEFINQDLLEYTTYVYRGHGDSTWKLEPTIDRIIKSPESSEREEILEHFKFSTRGRRGPNPPEMKSDNDWWALGQHHGLMTPLLDWTESPFVAMFFAVESALQSNTETCTVWALSQYSIEENNKAIAKMKGISLINGHKPTVKIVRPLSHENSRLVSQRGLFTRGPNNIDIESWIKKFHAGDDRGNELVKINIPNIDLEKCLKYLNRMNINNSTLFPDLSGAAEFCNKKIKITDY